VLDNFQPVFQRPVSNAANTSEDDGPFGEPILSSLLL